MRDLNNTEEFNPFSEKSKELITSMGNTEYFEPCETSSEIQCADCTKYWEADIIYRTCGKCMQPREGNRQLNKARYDVLSTPGYVTKKNPTHGARHGPSVRQTMYHKAHDLLRKARKHKSGGYKTILERCHDDDRYRRSLSDIGWTEEWKIIPTWLHGKRRSRNEKTWKFSFTKEDIQGPMNQRSDFIEAKHTCKILYDEHTEIIGEGNKPIPLA